MKSAILKKWKIPLDEGFIEIDNGDSVQLHNDDLSKIIYLSILSATSKNGEPASLSKHLEHKPEIVKDGLNFQLQGTKIRDNEALVVVITITKESDKDWALVWFKSVDYF